MALDSGLSGGELTGFLQFDEVDIEKQHQNTGAVS
jgi:hypothetical protein